MVEPKSPGNVGAVARAMKNFGLSRLALVNPCELDETAKKRAKHANDVLKAAKVYKSLKAATRKSAFVVATSGIISRNDKKFIRHPLTPREIAKRVARVKGEVALVFGREDYGLYNDELLLADILVNIPTSEKYPIMNISHACAVLFYDLYQPKASTVTLIETSKLEKERLNGFFAELLDAVDYPDHRKEKTKIMFRKMMGRAVPTKWEFYTLAGIIKDAAKQSRRAKRKK
ncbi:MAG: RNA methyltransferase [Euryarchaeota archaeon]|nr:RNA methyltransferase [Euryarchaeota archaeon]